MSSAFIPHFTEHALHYGNIDIHMTGSKEYQDQWESTQMNNLLCSYKCTPRCEHHALYLHPWRKMLQNHTILHKVAFTTENLHLLTLSRRQAWQRSLVHPLPDNHLLTLEQGSLSVRDGITGKRAGLFKCKRWYHRKKSRTLELATPLPDILSTRRRPNCRSNNDRTTPPISVS
jgi:hypothetical protein